MSILSIILHNNHTRFIKTNYFLKDKHLCGCLAKMSDAKFQASQQQIVDEILGEAFHTS